MTEGHSARPSIWPVTLALGVSIASAGVITHPVVLAGGALLSVFALAAWIVDMVRGA
ncbi:MAG TPA: hypothetical protein VLI88_02105 [Patescibacteria group bacterium]|nr:hypothetical protein [Patescibacteria group bacterium]